MLWVLWYRFWPHVVLVLACTAVFGRTLTGEFLNWDDAQHILQNPYLLNFEIGHFWKSEYYSLYIPVTYTLWTLLYHLWSSPLAFHLLNLTLHISNSILMYWLARKLLASRKKDAVELAESGRQTFALIAALTFAIHPFQVEAVSWISGGRDLLAGFFGLSAMIAAWNISDRLFPSHAAVVRRGGATGLFVLGLLSKPALAVLPLAVKWMSWFTERRGLKWIMMWVWLGLGACVGGLTMQLQSGFVANRIVSLSSWDKIVVALDALMFYLRKFLLNDYFSADYGRTPESVLNGGNLIPAWYWWILAAAVAILLWNWLPRALWGGLGFFVLMLLPVLGFFEFSAQAYSTVFDRYMYLPIAGLAIAFASLISESKTRVDLRILLAFALCGWWGYTSFVRAAVWHDDSALFEDVLEKNPTSYNALVNLALTDLKTEDLDGATQKLEAARSANPRLAVAWANLAHVYWLQKNPLMVKEVGQMLGDKKFIEYNRQEPQALALIARMLARAQTEEKSLESARDSYCYARTLNPVDKDLGDETEDFFKKNPDLTPCNP